MADLSFLAQHMLSVLQSTPAGLPWTEAENSEGGTVDGLVDELEAAGYKIERDGERLRLA